MKNRANDSSTLLLGARARLRRAAIRFAREVRDMDGNAAAVAIAEQRLMDAAEELATALEDVGADAHDEAEE